MFDFDDLEAQEEMRAREAEEKEAQTKEKEAFEKFAGEVAPQATAPAGIRAGEADRAADLPAGAFVASAGSLPLWQPYNEEAFESMAKAGDPMERPTNMQQLKEVMDKNEPGDFFGLKFPHTPEQLRIEYGPAWLTKAMHAAGTLPKDNKVLRFVQFDLKGESTETVVKETVADSNWGGAAIKILLSVEYEKDSGAEWPPRDMFVKLPHPLSGKSERFKLSISSYGMDLREALFYNHFGGRLPMPSPRNVFCEFCHKTTNFIIIIQRIPYGHDWRNVKNGEMYPAPGKYRDWAYPKMGAELYFAHAKALAQFFGWQHNSNQKTDQLQRLFMDKESWGLKQYTFDIVRSMEPKSRDEWFCHALQDPEWTSVISGCGFSPSLAKGFLAIAEDFIKETAAHTFPKELMGKAYLDRVFFEATEMGNYVAEMNFWDQMNPELWMLCHPNAQLDNAFYFKDQNGAIRCGLLDFGGVQYNTMTSCIGNGWMGAEYDMLDEYEEDLVKCFLDCYHAETAVRFDFDDFYMHVKLTQAAVFYGCCANTRWLVTIMKRADWKNVLDRKDKKVDHAFLIRCYYVQLVLFLGMWRKRSPYTMFRKWMVRTGLPQKS